MTGRIVQIQALRAVAAMLVVIAHAAYDADAVATRFGLPEMRIAQAFDWTFGIHLFFVISGFVMALTARDFGQPGAWSRFLLRRVVRIAPLYWVLTFAVVAGSLVAPRLLNVPVDGWGLLLGSLFFIPVLRINGEIRPVLGQGWTLNYEMYFYLCFALAMTTPRRIGLPLLTAAFCALVWLGRDLTPATPRLYVWTDGLLIEFLFGVWIGLARTKGARLPAAVAGALGVVGVAVALWLDPAAGRVYAPIFVLSGVPAAMIVAAAGLSEPPRGEGFALRAASFLGDASYAIYLVHPFVIRALREAWSATAGGALGPGVYLVVATLVSAGVGCVLYIVLERPMTRGLQRLLAERGSGAKGPLPSR